MARLMLSSTSHSFRLQLLLGGDGIFVSWKSAVRLVEIRFC